MLTAAEWEAVLLSLRVSAVAVLLMAPFGVGLAFLLARQRVRFSFLIDNIIQLPLILPPVVTGWVLLIVLGPEGGVGGWLEETLGIRLAFTWFGAALAAGIVSFPLMVQTVLVAFEQIDPAWEEAAYIYGGNRVSVFRYVTAPLAGRGIAAGLVLAFGRALGEFGATIVLAGNIPGESRTMPLAIFTNINRIGGEAAVVRLVVVAVLLSAASLLIHALLRRKLMSSSATPGE